MEERIRLLAFRENKIESLLEDDHFLEESLRKAYTTKVVFNDFLQELASEIAGILGGDDPSLNRSILSTMLSHPFREKFFAKLAKVAQG